MTSKLFQKLKEPEYRKAFVASQINVGIPFQIRALLKSRPGWTQTTLAKKAEMRQPSISALLTPGKTRPNIETLRRIANVFDCGLIVRFAPFGELAKWSEDFSPESFTVPSFDEESGANAEAEESKKLATAARQAALSLAKLTSSPQDQVNWTELFRKSANQQLQAYRRYIGAVGGLTSPYSSEVPSQQLTGTNPSDRPPEMAPKGIHLASKNQPVKAA